MCLFILRIVTLAVMLSACATSPSRTVVNDDIVGPAPKLSKPDANEGTLIVYSPLRSTSTPFDDQVDVHMPYDVLTHDGGSFRTIPNWSKQIADLEPDKVSLPQGEYRVVTQLNAKTK